MEIIKWKNNLKHSVTKKAVVSSFMHHRCVEKILVAGRANALLQMLHTQKHQVGRLLFITIGGNFCAAVKDIDAAVQMVGAASSANFMKTLVMFFLEGDGEYGKEFHTFWNWWVGEHPVTGVNRGQTLFAEPKARRIVEKVSPTTLSNGETLVLEVPLEHRTAYLINQFRTLLRDFDKRMQTARGKSRAKYPVYSKPVLTALHTALVVYDAMAERAKLPKKQQKTLAATFDDLSQKLPFFYVNDQVTFTYSERFDHEDAITDDVETDTFSLKQLESAAAKLGYVQSYDTAHNDSLPSALSDLRRVRAVVNRRKANALLRQWRIAEQYIANVEKGEFPKKLGR